MTTGRKKYLFEIGLLACAALFLFVYSAFGGAESLPVKAAADSGALFTFRDIVIPLANMGIGAIIAILLIWTIYPVINRNTETLREIAATLNVMSNNNLLISQKLLEIIERQTFVIRGRGEDK